MPVELKEAELRFMPRPGKPLRTENLRPISLTFCVGNVVERMVPRRLQAHSDETDQMPVTMYGFRQQLSTQGVLVQLNELTVKRATKNAPRGILALYLKGAFDNVFYASVLQSLRKTGCGRKTFGYIKNNLKKRTATITIRIGEERS